jgi:regulator of protease activity HflC (stomatin/prohibitin superfamily)
LCDRAVRSIRPGQKYYFEAEAEAADASAFFAFLCFLAFFGVDAEAEPEADIAEAEAEPEADGAAMWLAAKAETENRPATRAAISLVILVSLNLTC